ncbi:glycosyltransferase family protein [Anabaena azotica]|uniref:Glycosyltransferase n=1 Tax=Anabaena azotica FACHB-119 TaxID=947527 RepID=A0ABR8D642_9NOST|nr:glycosyltransferase [Anabaena azotica]MBD2501913.1 glycosyltransferase [Anabaena azotica FACHB-119]
MEKITKPRLVFFQCKYDVQLPQFLRLHKKQQVKCLSEFFEVIEISEDCDYEQICDKYQPEITLFENCGNNISYHRLTIKNTHVYPNIPKIGLHNADPWCSSRAAFISDMEHWGIETFFSICTTTSEHTPGIADNLFVWPNFVDTATYRDYGMTKIIPVLFNGANHALYPWRQKVQKKISQHYPSLICPHFGYQGNSTSRMIYGEQYARTINASWFVPACGTVAKEVVRKHFEIPGSKACLITEQSPSLEAAGFIDMQNCVFANEQDVLDKLDYLFQHQEELESIINAGYQLVHTRHTLKQRDQIFQWYNLYKNLKPHQKIIQTNPFETMTVVDKSLATSSSHIICNGLNIVLLRQANEKLWSGRYDEAEILYFKCLNYIAIMPEPQLGLAICNLYKGNPQKALDGILPMIQITIETYQASDPDPVEWAYFIISLLCLGKLDEATKRSQQFPSLNHTELNRTRWLINILNNQKFPYPLPSSNQLKCRASIHQLPNRDLNDWLNNIYIIFKSSQQLKLAENLRRIINLEHQELTGEQNNYVGYTITNSIFISDIKSKLLQKIWDLLGIKSTLDPINFILRNILKKRLGNLLRSLECKFGYFLPYHLSEKRKDEFYHAVQCLTQSEDIKTALVIGASAGAGSTEAFLTGIQQNPHKPIAFCINISLPRFIKLQKKYADNSLVNCYTISSGKFDNFIKKIKEENKIPFFDAILIDESELNFKIDLKNELNTSKIVIFEDINISSNYSNYGNLLADENYIIEAENLSLRNGYSIFKKMETANINFDFASTSFI